MMLFISRKILFLCFCVCYNINEQQQLVYSTTHHQGAYILVATFKMQNYCYTVAVQFADKKTHFKIENYNF